MISKLFFLFLILGLFQQGQLQEDHEIPSLDIEQIAMDYLKYNFHIVNALTSGSDDADGEESSTTSPGFAKTKDDTIDEVKNKKIEDEELYTGSSAGSSFGMGQLLAVINVIQSKLSVNFGLFQGAFTDAPDYLTEIYQLLLSAVLDDQEFQVSSTIYMAKPEKLDQNETEFLEQLNTNVVPIDFNSENVVNVLNSKIFNSTGQSQLSQNYIPSGTKSLPKSTRAMLIHTLNYNEKWSTHWKKIGTRVFSSGTNEYTSEFIEISGNFPYLESDRAIEVSIPIKNDFTRVLSLILPRNIEDAYNGDLGDARNGTSRLRIQIPVFNFTIRVPHKGGVGVECDVENFLNVVDDLTFVKFDDQGISAVAITGIQINNVVEYKDELLQLQYKSVTKNSTAQDETDAKKNPPLPEPSKLVQDGNKNGNNLDKTIERDEKIIIFDRPFTCTLVDESLFPIPIFSAAVVSLSSNLDLTEAVLLNHSHVFGLDESSSQNFNCL